MSHQRNKPLGPIEAPVTFGAAGFVLGLLFFAPADYWVINVVVIFALVTFLASELQRIARHRNEPKSGEPHDPPARRTAE